MTLDEAIQQLEDLRLVLAGKVDVKVQSEGRAVYEIRKIEFSPTWPAIMIRTKRKRGQRG